MTNSNPDDRHNRVARIAVRHKTIQPLFTGEIVVADRLPDDARLVRTYNDPLRREFNFVFQHESFDPVDEGEVIPQLNLEFRRLSEESTSEVK